VSAATLRFTVEELAALTEALEAQIYWQLSDEAYRHDGDVREPGADDPEKVAAIAAARNLIAHLQERAPTHLPRLDELGTRLFEDTGGINATQHDTRGRVLQSIASFLCCLADDLDVDGGVEALGGLVCNVTADVTLGGRNPAQRRLYGAGQSDVYLDSHWTLHGRKVRVSIRRNFYDSQSYARVAVFGDNLQWNHMAELSPAEMQTFQRTSTAMMRALDAAEPLFLADEASLIKMADMILGPL
jgi:hypothetical protein